MTEKQTVEIQVWSGAEGPCIYINNYRICGPKPWGGNPTHTWQADLKELLANLPVSTVHGAPLEISDKRRNSMELEPNGK